MKKAEYLNRVLMRKRAFAQALAAGQTHQEALAAAGYKPSRETPRRLLKDAAVQKELNELQERRRAQSMATRDEVVQILTAQLRAGSAPLLRSEERGVRSEDGDDEEATGPDYKLMALAQGAAKELARIEGWCKAAKVEVEHKGVDPARMSLEELKAAARKILKQHELQGTM